jgi:TetR/AcrR family transcriptional regulator, transcriptional repressor of bet genes
LDQVRNTIALERSGQVPKQVDHQQRREQIAEAVCRLARRQGLDAVTLRHVAAEAGVSMGRVQHYFTTKDEMLLFAFHTLSERVERRMAAAATDLGPSPTPRALLRALLMEMLPLSEQATAEAPVLAAFFARAVVEPKLADVLRGDNRRLREFITEQVGATHGDPGLETVGLLAMVDGLMVHLLLAQTDTTTAVATLDYHLDRIFGSG